VTIAHRKIINYWFKIIKSSIEIETEFVMPLLGFDVEKVFLESNNKKIIKILSKAIKNNTKSQQIENYTISIKDKIRGSENN